jgi:hypothetical protein
MEALLFFPIVLGLGYLVITVLIIINIINNHEIDSNNKLFWIAMILFFNLLGLIVYLVVQDKNVLK